MFTLKTAVGSVSAQGKGVQVNFVVSNAPFLANISRNSKICLLRLWSMFRFLPSKSSSQRSLYPSAATLALQRLRSSEGNGSRPLQLGSSSSVVACSQVLAALRRIVLELLTQVMCS